MTNAYQQITRDFKHKTVLIVGLGIQGGGLGVVKFFQKIGSQVVITDMRTQEELAASLNELDLTSIKLALGGHNLELLDSVDCIIRNPAVPRESQFLSQAKQRQIPIFMESALFAKYATRPVVGITGTRGKTTTTTLIYNLLKSAGEVTLGGNIPGSNTLGLLETESDTIIAHVLELSSWQLQGFDDLKISPHIAVLTNIYPDHLNRYNGMDEYIADKAVITKYQSGSDFFVYHAADPKVQDIATGSSARLIPFTANDLDSSLNLQLPGLHNRANAAAAQAVAKLFSLPDNSIKQILQSQTSLPFRLQKITTIKGVDYINDTTSTTPVATITAINAQTKPTIVIIGGQSKNLPLDDLVKIINTHPIIKGVVLIPGSGTNELMSQINQSKIIQSSQTLEQALSVAQSLALEGDCILFSPGFTSFDQYRNEFERGHHFNQLVLPAHETSS